MLAEGAVRCCCGRAALGPVGTISPLASSSPRKYSMAFASPIFTGTYFVIRGRPSVDIRRRRCWGMVMCMSKLVKVYQYVIFPNDLTFVSDPPSTSPLLLLYLP